MGASHAPGDGARIVPDRAAHPTGTISAIHERIINTLRRHAPTVMRLALGLVFVWFGALKVAYVTAASQTSRRHHGLHSGTTVRPRTRAWRIRDRHRRGIGRRPVAATRTGGPRGPPRRHLPGACPAACSGLSGREPLLLTTEGEFVVKNLVLIAGALLVAAALTPLRTGELGAKHASAPSSAATGTGRSAASG